MNADIIDKENAILQIFNRHLDDFNKILSESNLTSKASDKSIIVHLDKNKEKMNYQYMDHIRG